MAPFLTDERLAKHYDETMSGYEINPENMGVVVIVNNYQFKKSTLNLPGGEHDSERLQNLFNTIGFKTKDIHLLENKQRRDLRTKFQEISQSIKAEHGAFILCLLSHGNRNDEILTSDGSYLNLWTNIMINFGDESCPNLARKPKLVIKQCCQDNETSSAAIKNTAEKSTDEFINNYSDTLVLKISPKHSPTLYNESGSIFVQTFCEICKKFNEGLPITDIITMISHQLSSSHNSLMCSNTMNKLFYLKPTEKLTEEHDLCIGEIIFEDSNFWQHKKTQEEANQWAMKLVNYLKRDDDYLIFTDISRGSVIVRFSIIPFDGNRKRANAAILSKLSQWYEQGVPINLMVENTTYDIKDLHLTDERVSTKVGFLWETPDRLEITEDFKNFIKQRVENALANIGTFRHFQVTENTDAERNYRENLLGTVSTSQPEKFE